MPESKQCSIHEIAEQKGAGLRVSEIDQLFVKPSHPTFDISCFQRHPYMSTSSLFVFFVQEISKWNCKVQKSCKENKDSIDPKRVSNQFRNSMEEHLQPFSYAELNRNTFVYTSLKMICLKKPAQAEKRLQILERWFSKNSYNVPQRSVLLRNNNPNEEWEVRQTFKSNAPLELKTYQRRQLCGQDKENDQNLARKIETDFDLKTEAVPFSEVCSEAKSTERGLYRKNLQRRVRTNQCDSRDGGFQKHTITVENRINRKSREKKEAQNFRLDWKKCNSKFYEKATRNYFQGNFDYNSQYLVSSFSRAKTLANQQQSLAQTGDFGFQKPRNLFSAKNESRNFKSLQREIKKGRIRTSMGLRRQRPTENSTGCTEGAGERVELTNGVYQKQRNNETSGNSVKIKVNDGNNKNPERVVSNVENKNDEIPALNNNWIEQFDCDDSPFFRTNRGLLNVQGLSLISNPFEIKKKGKKPKRVAKK